MTNRIETPRPLALQAERAQYERAAGYAMLGGELVKQPAGRILTPAEMQASMYRIAKAEAKRARRAAKRKPQRQT
jgi:hypothetical protein